MKNLYEVRLEITVLVNSLKELFNEIHCPQAKLKLLEAHMWAERALTSDNNEDQIGLA